MRLLLVTPFPPDPSAAHGGGVYLSSLVAGLAARAELGLATLATADERARCFPAAEPWQWLGIADREERPVGRGRTSHRMRMLWRWRRWPLVAAKHQSAQFCRLLATAIAEWQPDAALVEMAQMAQFLPSLRGLPTVLTDHEAGCPANTTTGLGPLGDRRDRRLWRRYVRHFYPMASLVQAVTSEDAGTLSALLGREVGVRAPSVLVPSAPVAAGEAPARALFLGDYRHQPNPEAATMLAKEVLPRLRQQQPDIELWLAGPHSERVAALAGVPGVRIVGFAADLRQLFAQVRMVLAPVFSGTGARMKSLVALAHGLPVVTNSLGARGCSAPTTARQVVEGAPALAAASLLWLGSPAAAAAAGRAAFAWAQQHLSAEAVAEQQLQRIAALQKPPRT